VVFAIWIGVGVADRPSEDCPPGDTLCQDASDVGTSIGVGIVLVLFFIGFVVLSLIWFMTRPKGRMCPACGTTARKGELACRRCGHDFAHAAGVHQGVEGPSESKER
jgi:hypothetical protein